MRIDWKNQERGDFEELVEAILHRHHQGARVWSPEDSGGDGGRDVLVEYPNRTIIYQLKHFTDGLVSKPDARKRQIKRSFIAALAHDPTEWVLVFPSKVNGTMRDFLRDLPRDKQVKAAYPKGVKVDISFLDRPRLDILLAQYPDLCNLVERKDGLLLREVIAYGQEKAVLHNGVSDLADRVEGLGVLANSADPHWGVGFSQSNGITYTWPEAKHLNASEASPIVITPTIDLSALPAESRTAFEQVVEFGRPGSVLVPRMAIRSIEYVGPEFFRVAELPEALLVGREESREADQVPAIVSMTNTEGERLSRYPVIVTDRGRGTDGGYFDLSIRGVIKVSVTLPDAGSPTCGVQMSVAGRSLDDVRVATSAILAMQEADRVTLSLSGGDIMSFSINGDSDQADEFRLLRCVAEDLRVLQDATNDFFDFPDGLTYGEAAVIRAFRLAFDGHTALFPRFAMEWEPFADLDEESIQRAETGALFLTVARAQGTFGGVRVEMDEPVCFFLPDAKVKGLREVIAFNKENPGEHKTAKVKSASGEPFRVYMPGRRGPQSGDPEVPDRWGLPLIPELDSAYWPAE